jgi:hypothetical protein
MTVWEMWLRRIAAQLPAERAPQAVSELVDTIVELLHDVPQSRSIGIVADLVATTFRPDPAEEPTHEPRARLHLVVDNGEVCS